MRLICISKFGISTFCYDTVIIEHKLCYRFLFLVHYKVYLSKVNKIFKHPVVHARARRLKYFFYNNILKNKTIYITSIEDNIKLNDWKTTV